MHSTALQWVFSKSDSPYSIHTDARLAPLAAASLQLLLSAAKQGPLAHAHTDTLTHTQRN